jgi:hypothetical protein
MNEASQSKSQSKTTKSEEHSWNSDFR